MLTEIYNNLFGEEAPATEKTASETTQAADATATESAPGTEAESTIETFGKLAGEYFNVIAEEYFDKMAMDAASAPGHSPMAPHDGGQMGAIIGKQGDPHMKVNHERSEAPIHAANGASTPYSLKGAALKGMLKKMKESEALNGSIEE